MDSQIRLATFDWLQDQIQIHGEVLPWSLLTKGFQFHNQQIHVVGAKGIWKPKTMQLPLSIITKFEGPYSDSFTKEGLLAYSYRGTKVDINHSDNAGLREVMKQKLPLVYFSGVGKGRYFAAFPVYIIHDNPSRLTFTVQVDQMTALSKPQEAEDTDSTHWRRKYATTSTKIRLHQQYFRERVLTAYHHQCTLCQLKHSELLDAAHIIPDTDELGAPIVPNGLSLCKIHHAAFDSNIIGINTDYEIKIRSDILEEINGPILKYGIQELNNQKLILPSRNKDWPDKERLEIRFDKFRNAG